MPHYCFICPDGTIEDVNPQTGQRVRLPDQRVAGCVERLCCSHPAMRAGVQTARHPQTGQMVQQRVAIPDVEAAWNWLTQTYGRSPQNPNGLIFSPHANYKCTVTNSARGVDNVPSMYCVQIAYPAVVRENVNAPTSQPVGNSGHEIGPPPMSGQPRAVPPGAFEEMPDAALAANSDPAFGEIDPQGGTYTDIDSQGQEVRRELYRPASVPIQQRNG